MQYEIKLNVDQQNIAIMRCENGWLIRTDHPGSLPSYTLLRVAESVRALTDMVAEWASAQEVAR